MLLEKMCLNMKRILISAAVSAVAAAGITAVLYHVFHTPWLLTTAITAGTISYHLVMRLLVGGIVTITMHNHADYHKKWFQLSHFEERLYSGLKVKRWKNHLPTYAPESFSPEKHTFDEIAQAMCQSEIVHEINMVLSFLPLLASLWFGSFAVFCITSIAAACFDLLFVIVQRYNRPRIVKIAEKQGNRKKKGKSMINML